MALLVPKIGPCRSAIDPPNPVSDLLSLDVDSERLQHLIVPIEMGTQDLRGGEISTLSPALAAPLWVTYKACAKCKSVPDSSVWKRLVTSQQKLSDVAVRSAADVASCWYPGRPLHTIEWTPVCLAARMQGHDIYRSIRPIFTKQTDASGKTRWHWLTILGEHSSILVGVAWS